MKSIGLVKPGNNKDVTCGRFHYHITNLLGPRKGYHPEHA